MRRTATLTTILVLVAAAATFAAEIPDRPEELKFPDLTFDVPDADSLRFELADGTPVYAKQDKQFPLVNITVYFRGGRYLVPAGKEGLAAITSAAWRTGGAGTNALLLVLQCIDQRLHSPLITYSGQYGGSTYSGIFILGGRFQYFYKRLNGSRAYDAQRSSSA